MALRPVQRCRWFPAPFILLAFLSTLTAALTPDHSSRMGDDKPAYEADQQHVIRSNPQPTFLEDSGAPAYTVHSHVLQNIRDALSVMQDQYFSLWLGQWTTAIDWTAAVMGTHVAATLTTLSHSISYTIPGTFTKPEKPDIKAQMTESEINKYFQHLITYYFGQDYFSIRNQAYDDMLWVVLGWLDAIQLIKTHSARHYPDNGDGRGDWQAMQFIPAFAHRSRVFYELAEEGWDWRLCGGGMTWNPALLPYKNAITNQLFISASVNMYLYFPGDDNCSPFMGASDFKDSKNSSRNNETKTFSSNACSDSDDNDPEYDPIYLANAVNGYDWLANSGMLNDQGLYTDGFHISGYAQNNSRTECDERNEMVYTYNQGVILSGLRGLWEATGNLTYLSDAHTLITNVIRATGWTTTPTTSSSFTHPGTPPSPTHRTPSPTTQHSSAWAGLGAHGILTELCDPSASCSQDSQTFKGVFFHHLTDFCAPLPTWPARQGKTHHAVREVYELHRRSCDQYVEWVVHNAEAALETRDEGGRFGMWWGAGGEAVGDVVLPRGSWDYRDESGVLGARGLESASMVDGGGDSNDRGRGRTVETQGGGVAVVRAMWEFLRRREGYDEDVGAATRQDRHEAGKESGA